MPTQEELKARFEKGTPVSADDNAPTFEDKMVFGTPPKDFFSKEQEELKARFEKGTPISGGFAPFFNRGVTSIAGAPGDIINAGASLAMGKDVQPVAGTPAIEEAIRRSPTEISKTLGAPVDLITSGLNLIPGVDIEDPLFGSESIRKSLEPFVPVFPKKGQQAETIPEHIGQVTGETAALLFPQTLALKTLQGGKSLISRIATEMNKQFIARPGLTLASEGTAAASAGTARGVLENSDIENQGLKTGLEVAAGIGGGLTPIALIHTPSAIAVREGKRLLTKLAFPFTKAGKQIRAAEGIAGELSRSPEIVSSKVSSSTIADMPPVVKSGEKRLISMYKTLLAKDPVKEAEATDRLGSAIIKLEGEMRKLGFGSPDLVIDITRARVAALETRMNNRITSALQKAENELKKIPQAQRESMEAVIVNRELRKEYDRESALVRDLWNKVDNNLPVGVENARKRFLELSKNVARDQRKTTIPAELKTSRITKLGREEDEIELSDFFEYEDITEFTVLDVRGLRERLLEISRDAATKNKKAKKRFVDEMAKALLRDLGVAADVPSEALTPGAAKLKAALAGTRKLRQKFQSGIIGDILGVEETGVPAIDPTLTLNKSVGRQGEAGAVDINKLIATPEAKNATERYLGRSFADFATNDAGELLPVKAFKWIKNNEDILDSFPDLRKKMTNTASAQELAIQTRTAQEARIAALRDPKISNTARLLSLDHDMSLEIKAILASKNPTREAQVLMRRAERISPEAVEGVRGGFIENLLDNSFVGQYNELGEQTLSGSTLLANIRKNRNTLEKVFSKEQIQRMLRIGSELSKIEQVGKIALTKKDIIELKDAPTNVLRTLFRIAGARAGGLLGQESTGGSLQMASIASSSFQKFMLWATRHNAEQLVYDALMSSDPTLLKALLAPIKKPPTATRPSNLFIITKRLETWLGSTGKRVMEDINREENLNKP